MATYYYVYYHDLYEDDNPHIMEFTEDQFSTDNYETSDYPQVLGPSDPGIDKYICGFETSDGRSFHLNQPLTEDDFTQLFDTNRYSLDLYPIYSDFIVHFVFNANDGNCGNGFIDDNGGIIFTVNNTDGGLGEIFNDVRSLYDSYQIPNANMFGLTRQGHRFVGWSDDHGQVFEPGQTISIRETWPDGFENGTEYGADVILTAVWEVDPDNVQEYTVYLNIPLEYCIDGGAYENLELNVTRGDGTRLPSIDDYIPDGHTFLGWKTSEGDDEYATWYENEALIDDETPDLISDDVYGLYLEAAYGMSPFTITFDGNGADSGSMDPETWYDCKNSLSENQFGRIGFEFIGWNTEPDGSGTWYDDGEASIHSDSDFTLYAQWEGESRDTGTIVTFLANDACYFNIPEHIQNYPDLTIGDNYVTIELWPDSSGSGYWCVDFFNLTCYDENLVFFGWYDENGTPVYNKDGKALPSDYWYYEESEGPPFWSGESNTTLTLHPRWEVLDPSKQHTITWYDTDGKIIGEQKYTPGYDDYISSDIPFKYGYEFIHWFDDDGAIWSPGEYFGHYFTADFNLIANWERDKGDTGSFVTFHIDSDASFPEIPDYITNGAIAVTPSYITLELWINSYDHSNVSFLEPCKETEDGVVFFGWYDEHGTQVYNKDGNAVSSHYWWYEYGEYLWSSDEDVELYPRWGVLDTSKEITIRYECYNGEDGPTEQKCIPGYNTQITTQIPYLPGYEFIGWVIDADSSVWYPGQNFGEYFKEDVIFYAWYEPFYCTINFNANGGKNKSGGLFDYKNFPEDYWDWGVDATYGEEISSVTTRYELDLFTDMSSNIPTCDYYTFLGWYTLCDDGSFGECVYDENGYYVPGTYWSEDGLWLGECDVELYASWTPCTYMITLNANGGKNPQSFIFDEYDGADYGDGKTTSKIPVYYEESIYNDIHLVPTRPGHKFLGWIDDYGDYVYDEYGYYVEGSYWGSHGCWIYPYDITLYASWQPTPIYVKKDSTILEGSPYILKNSIAYQGLELYYKSGENWIQIF